MFDRLGGAVTRRPVLVILVWAAVLLALTGVGVGYAGARHWNDTDTRQSSGLPAEYESARAQRIADRAFGVPDDRGTATLVLSRVDHRPLTRADVASAERLVERVDRKAEQRTRPAAVHVSTGPGQLSPDRKVLLAQAVFDKPSDDRRAQTAATGLDKDLTEATEGTRLRGHLTGETAAMADDARMSAVVMYAMIAVVFVLLIALFRSLLIAVLSLVTITLVGFGVTGLLTIGAHLAGVQIGKTATELLPVVLFGVGTDYIVFLLYRYRERLRTGQDHRTAMAAGVGRVGEAVVSSALAVAVSFVALLASQMPDFRVLGPALGVSVLVMLLASLTLVPALFTVLGGRLSRRPSWRRAPALRVTGPVAGLVARRPAAVAGAATLLLAALASFAFGYKADYDMSPYQKGSHAAQGYAELKSAFPEGVLTPTQVMVTAEKGTLSRARLAPYASRLERLPDVGEARVVRISDDAKVAQIDMALTINPTGTQALRAHDDVLVPKARALAPPGTSVALGGLTAAYADTGRVVGHDLRLIIPIAAVAIGVILLLTLRAVLAPLYLMAAVGLGFAATLGSAVLLFQHIQHKPGVTFTVPLIVYLFVASIGTDYNILMIARLREELVRGATPREAARYAVVHAGPSVAAAGVILAASFGVLGFSSSTASVGLPVAMGVVLATFVTSWLLIPALTALVGHRAFWPSRTGARRSRGGEHRRLIPADYAGIRPGD
ncbi:MMPL family transporter [Streptomyces sp. NPDC026673]|uniref:MMPL family transporter n=1 Tax=Streptomyces sp. NPDC026673 TaxID=3155724 RepID=UPI0033D44BCC